jgi:tetratricopeptide (TPR) repeat protein
VAESRGVTFLKAIALSAASVAALVAVAHPLKRNLENLRAFHSLPQPLQRTRIDRFGSGRAPAERKEPADPVALALRGDAEWLGGDPTAAREAWAGAGDYHRLLAAGAFLQNRHDLDAAESMYAAAARVRPGSPEAPLAIAALQWNRGRLAAAEQSYGAMIANHPRAMGEVPYASLATIYAEQGEYGRADAVLRRGLGYWPNSIALRTTAGMTDARAGRMEQAVRKLRAVLAEKPGSNDACYWLGWTYLQQRNDREAARQFATCLEYTPNDPKTLYQEGIAFLRLNDRKGARAAFQRLHEISPNDAAARDRLRETEQALR